MMSQSRRDSAEAPHRHGACPQVRGLAGGPEQRVAVARERAVHRPSHLHRLAGRTGAGVESQLDGLVDLHRQRARVGRKPGDAGRPRRRHAHVPAVHRAPAAVAPRDGDHVRPDVRRRRREGRAPLPAAAPSSVHCARSPAPAGATKSMWSPTCSLSFRSAGAASPCPARSGAAGTAPPSGPASATPPAATSAASAASPEPQHAGRAARTGCGSQRAARSHHADARARGRVGRTGRSHVYFPGDPAARGPSRADVPARDRGARARSVRAGRHRLLRSLRYVSPIGQRLPASNGRDQLRRQQRLHRGRELSGRVSRRWDGDCGVRGLPAERRLSRQRSLHRRHLRPRRLQAQQRRRRERVRRRRPVHGRRSMHRRRLLWSVDDLRRRVRVTDDFCDGGACVHRPDSSVCVAPNECSEAVCQPGVGADAQGCVATGRMLDQTFCTEDGDPCTDDRCGGEACVHTPMADPADHAARPVLSPRGLAARRHRSPGRAIRGRSTWAATHERQPGRI